jgi:hypothetical protein
MTDAEGTVNTIAHGAEDAGEEMLSVFAEYIAPIVGLAVGWALGTIVGGAGTVGNLVYQGLQSANVANATRIADVTGGFVLGGIFACIGGAFWTGSSSKTKKAGSAIVKALMRFASGVGFGMALCYVVNGLTGNVQSGWIEKMADGISKEA